MFEQLRGIVGLFPCSSSQFVSCIDPLMLTNLLHVNWYALSRVHRVLWSADADGPKEEIETFIAQSLLWISGTNDPKTHRMSGFISNLTQDIPLQYDFKQGGVLVSSPLYFHLSVFLRVTQLYFESYFIPFTLFICTHAPFSVYWRCKAFHQL